MKVSSTHESLDFQFWSSCAYSRGGQSLLIGLWLFLTMSLNANFGTLFNWNVTHITKIMWEGFLKPSLMSPGAPSYWDGSRWMIFNVQLSFNCNYFTFFALHMWHLKVTWTHENLTSQIWSSCAYSRGGQSLLIGLRLCLTMSLNTNFGTLFNWNVTHTAKDGWFVQWATHHT